MRAVRLRVGIFRRIFGIAEGEESSGIELGTNPKNWCVQGVSDASLFFSALPKLVTNTAVIALHDPLGKDVVDFAAGHAATETSKVAPGTIWPRSKIYHVQCTADNLRRLQDLADRHAQPEIAIHIHVYEAGRVLLEWYDAFDDPIYLAPEFPESDVSVFAAHCHASYGTEAT